MRNLKRMTALALSAGAALALTAPIVGATGQPGQTVELKTSVTINNLGYAGKVKAANANCVEQRVVVLKQKGHGGTLGRSVSDEEGRWRVSPEAIPYKGGLPYSIYAEVKPLTQGTAGTIFKCLGATSKTVEITGG